MIPFLGPADPFPPVEQALDQPEACWPPADRCRRGGWSMPIGAAFFRGSTRAIRSCGGRRIRARCCAPSRIHVSHSLRKRLRKASFIGHHRSRVRARARWLRRAAPGRHRHVAEPADAPRLRALHAAGLAHSIEVWMDGELAGGIYGVAHRPDVLRRVDVLAPHRRVEDRDGAPGRAARSLGVSR